MASRTTALFLVRYRKHARLVLLVLLLSMGTHALAFAQPICNPAEVRAIDPGMSVTAFSTIQAAVNAAGIGWQIFVGSGTYNEVVVINSKTNLTITTECNAVVSGFRLLQSDTITIEEFDVNATGSGSPGISLLGGINSNQNITIQNNEVHGSSQDGIQVARDNVNVRILRNHVHDNQENGIAFIDATGGPNLVDGNRIESNGFNGIFVARSQIVTISNNTIVGNGTRTGNAGGRYGILRERVSGPGNSSGITLIDNVVVGNRGQLVSGQSSSDLGNFDQMLDGSDSGNLTTAGTEGPGVSAYLPLSCNLEDSAWRTVDNFQLSSGFRSEPQPSALAGDNQGNVFVAGLADAGGSQPPPFLSNSHLMVRMSRDQGNTWNTILDVPPPTPNETSFDQHFPRFVLVAQNDDVYVSGQVADGTIVRPTVFRLRASVVASGMPINNADWEVVDSFQLTPTPFRGGQYFSIAEDQTNGDLYAVGSYGDAGNFQHWIVRRSPGGASAGDLGTWSTVEDHTGDGTPAFAIDVVVDLLGTKYVIGQIFRPNFHMFVRESASGDAGTWNRDLPGEFDFILAGATDMSPRRIVLVPDGSTSGALYSASTAVAGATRTAVIRRSTDGGANWGTVSTFPFSGASLYTTVTDLDFLPGPTVADPGEFYLTLSRDSSWVVLRSRDRRAATWETVDRFQLTPGSVTAATALVSDSSNNLFVSGNGNDGVSSFSQRWLVRKINIDCADPVLRNVVGIDTGNFTGDHTCAVVEDPDSGIRASKCWGQNDEGQVGNGTVVPLGVRFPEDVLNDGFLSLSAGSTHTCGVTSLGIRCWGRNFYGELGNGQDGAGQQESIPVDVSGIASGASQVSAGLNYTCAVINGAASCWGFDNVGKLGNGPLAGSTNVPTSVVGLTGTVVAVSAGFTTTCAVVQETPTRNSAQCWGSDALGALGDGGGIGGVSHVAVPVDFQGAIVDVQAIDASTNFVCAVLDEEVGAMTVSGKVKCWGDNSEGQLGAGLPTAQHSTVPVDVIDAVTLTPI